MGLRAAPWISNSETLNGDNSSWTERGGEGGTHLMSKFASSEESIVLVKDAGGCEGLCGSGQKAVRFVHLVCYCFYETSSSEIIPFGERS